MKTFTSQLKVAMSIIVIIISLLSTSTLKSQSISVTDSTQTSLDLGFTFSGDSILIIMSTDNSFDDPVNGSYYKDGDAIGSDVVIYSGIGSSWTESSLTRNTRYYFKAWNNADPQTYTLIGTATQTTTNYEPTYHVTSFSATTHNDAQITLTWTDASGFITPDAYLILASTGTITNPVDGTPQTDATLIKNITQGTQTVIFNGLDGNTLYNFKIYP
jgi:hypothetical protein